MKVTKSSAFFAVKKNGRVITDFPTLKPRRFIRVESGNQESSKARLTTKVTKSLRFLRG